jgi:hypothetical protein
MIDPKKIIELTKDLDDVLGNLEAVRGKHFANAVAGYFESRQMIEIMSMLCGMAPEEHAAQANAMAKAGVAILSSITRKAFIDMTEADLAEVMKTGDSLLERRARLTDKGAA